MLVIDENPRVVGTRFVDASPAWISISKGCCDPAFCTHMESDNQRNALGAKWKPFFGFRWMEFEDVNAGYVRLEDTTDFDKKVTLNVDLGLGELEVKQKHFNKWRGDALTNKLIEYLFRQDVTEKYQFLIQKIAEGVEEGKYRPKGVLNRMTLDLVKARPKYNASNE